IITHAIDPDKSHSAERWLLGEVMDPDELYYLGLSTNLNAPFVAMELLQLLLKFLPEGLLLIIDDLDESWSRYNNPYHIEDDWTMIPFTSTISNNQGLESSTSEIKNGEKQHLVKIPDFFQDLYQIFATFPNIHLVFTIKPDNEGEIMQYFEPLIEETEAINSIILPAFSENDLKNFYNSAIQIYCKLKGLNYNKITPLFPWNSEFFHLIYNKTSGNPRKIIRKLQDAFDYYLYDRKPVDKIVNLI
ncbi:MAG: hypothetical protein ACTSUK_05740, partial [Promethearchaeota archaeon]